MLEGQAATEQCLSIDDVNFLNNADVDGMTPAAGGRAQHRAGARRHAAAQRVRGRRRYVFKYHVDWSDPANSTLTGPTKITVARYHYLCNGQLTSCVTQPGTDPASRFAGRQADAARGVSQLRRPPVDRRHALGRHAGGRRARCAGTSSASTPRDPYVYQQSSYRARRMYRWMGSAAMDRMGNIGIGYSFGGVPNFPASASWGVPPLTRWARCHWLRP